jgi:hypothetical protein
MRWWIRACHWARADLVDLSGKVGKSWLALATDSFATLARDLRGG